MNLEELFIELTKETIPHGFEKLLYDKIPGARIDMFGNAYVVIGEYPNTMFTCHLDTHDVGEPKHVNIKKKAGIIKTDGKTILGADDKSGMVILINMIENNVPGLYYFFAAEEIGRLGSKYAASSEEFLDHGGNIESVISFDRKGYDSIITHQSGLRTCSDRFGLNICEAFNEHDLNMDLDVYGGMTDSLSFCNVQNVLNCTNISVGYFNQHKNDEYQDMKYLKKIAKAAISIDWSKI